MRILLTTPTYPPFNSGLGNAVAQQAISLAKAGHEVVVATGGERRDSRSDNYGVRVELFPVSGANSWLQPIKGDIDNYIKFLQGSSWDVVLLNAWQNWATDLALENLGLLRGRKFVYSHCVSTNTFFPHQPLRSLIRYIAWRPYWWRLPRFMRQLDGILFLANNGVDSRFDDLKVVRKCHLSWQVIPNGLSPAAQESLTLGIPARLERDRLMAVGSYQWQKGFDFVLRAYAASSMRNRVPLHLFGQHRSGYSVSLTALAEKLGVTPEFVVLHEGVSGNQLMAEYRRSYLVLSGSHTECQPLALIDASATGTPFIARATGCITNMPGGIAVTKWQDMAAQIDELMAAPSRWQSLSNDTHAAANNIYHPDIVARKLLLAITGETIG